MEFAVNSLSTGIDHFESMATVAIHMTVAEWCASTTEQEWHLVCCFWSQTQEVPEHVGILSQQYTTADSVRCYVSHSVLTDSKALHS